jgi:anthranilate phosphoribosyltransferase
MKQFRLSRQSPGATITKFHVYDSAGDIIGSINVANEDAADLQKHWLGSATQPKATAAAALATSARGEQQNPMVAAMVRAAKKHPLNRAAILRGC